MWADGQTDIKTDMTKLRAAVRNFANAPKIAMSLIVGLNEALRLFFYARGHNPTPPPTKKTSDSITNDLLFC